MFSQDVRPDDSSASSAEWQGPAPSLNASWIPKIDYSRTIKVPGQPSLFCSNKICTAKYTALTWLPKSLVNQFRRVANIYFLIISVLTAMPFSPKNPFSMSGTFAMVLVATSLKEAYEDYFRHKADSKVNSAKTLRFCSKINEFEAVEWAYLNVGDLVLLKNNESVPADLLLLSSSNENGLAFVNTMNLDGETNLKEKVATENTRTIHVANLKDVGLVIDCDLPNMSLVKWNCNIHLNGSEKEPVGLKQLLVRGSVIVNTEYVIGIAVYTGAETKVMLNSKPAPSKMSQVLKVMNRMLVSVFAFQAIICISFAAGNINWNDKEGCAHDYLEIECSGTGASFVVQMLTFLVAYSHLIPISLYVSLEVVKVAISYLIGQDIQMYYSLDDRKASCRTSDLVEELGAVEVLFSDKTGTLTCNVMKLQRISVEGMVYGGENLEEDYKLHSALNSIGLDPHKHALDQFFNVLSVCHTCFLTNQKLETNSEFDYHATSPDELALVKGAAKVGYVFTSKSNGFVSTEFNKLTVHRWKVLAEIPFSYTRKRMSVVVKEPTTGNILLMTKGADSVMVRLLSSSRTVVDKLEHDLRSFAVEGLRTLVMGQRYLETTEFNEWSKVWIDLELSNSPDKEELMERHAEFLEHSYDLVGATAIEDKLQDQVPETIDLLMRAGIRVWILTGDKQETAVEIGKSCNLIKESHRLIDLSSPSESDLASMLKSLTEEFGLAGKEVSQLDKIKRGMVQPISIVIDGQSLTWVLGPDSRNVFFKLSFIAESCICCRVSPAQKMQVVQLVKENGTWVTLSIGDGANDVSMIQEAHIGVGIAGKEGTQAVQSADYALAQFQYLSRLLLVHGRWCYRRITMYICYYFYKNIAVVFTELWFAFFNGFSGQIFFLDLLPMLYNSLWTSWPCMFTFTLEQDCTDKESLAFPILYAAGQRQVYFGYRQFWKWVVLSIVHGAVCFWVPMVCFTQMADGEGHEAGLWMTSTVSFTLLIHVITYKLYLESVYWNKFNIIAGVVSLGFYYLTVIVLNTTTFSPSLQPQLEGLFFSILGNLKAWMLIVCVPFIAILPDFFIRAYSFLFKPTPLQSVMANRALLGKVHPEPVDLSKRSLFHDESLLLNEEAPVTFANS